MIAVIEQHHRELDELCTKYGVARLDMIGSAARGDFRTADSDLDFVVVFTKLTPSDAADRYFGLLASLEDLFNRKIDLISYTAIRNPYFKQVVDRTRVPLYATRNVIVHGYDAIDDVTTWGVIENKLPVLRRELAALMPSF